MNTDVEDLLREGMELFIADLRAPADLIRRVARRRRRRLVQRTGAGVTAVLAVSAVALVAVDVPGSGSGPVVATAYVVKHVDSALSTAAPDAIAQMTVTTHGLGGTITAEEWSYGDRWRSVTDSPAGHQIYDEGFSSASAFTLVNYRSRTWARQAGLGRPDISQASGPRGCGPVAGALPFLFQPGLPVLPGLSFQPGLPVIGFSASSPPATVAKALRTAISCGTLTVAGRQRVDGIEAIKLTSRADSLISETIWVNPGTYLPVRVVASSSFGTPALRLTADIAWLPPTAQNLAKLTVPIPTGFRQVPLIQAVLPIFRQSPGGLLLPKPGPTAWPVPARTAWPLLPA